jgi:hypothetical protein
MAAPDRVRQPRARASRSRRVSSGM